MGARVGVFREAGRVEDGPFILNWFCDEEEGEDLVVEAWRFVGALEEEEKENSRCCSRNGEYG